MIDYLIGIIKKKMPSYSIVEVNNIAFMINITTNCYDKLPESNKEVKLLIYFHVNENKFELYGFCEEEERELFIMLISISGIGPKTAINMLSAVPPIEFKNRLIAGEVKMLTSLPGIGPKTARRIIVELKDKFGKFNEEELPLEDVPINNDAFYALKNLGFSPMIIRKVLNEIQLNEKVVNTEQIIKEALKILK